MTLPYRTGFTVLSISEVSTAEKSGSRKKKIDDVLMSFRSTVRAWDFSYETTEGSWGPY